MAPSPARRFFEGRLAWRAASRGAGGPPGVFHRCFRRPCRPRAAGNLGADDSPSEAEPCHLVNLINVADVTKAYGPKPLLHGVSLGVDAGDRIGVVGRNGDGKTTLVSILAKRVPPDDGRVTHARDLRIALLTQRDEFPGRGSVRDVVLGERHEHEWAGDARIRDIFTGLLGDVDLDAIDWLARRLRERAAALIVVTHDRWFLDEVTDRTWEVVDGGVERYEGGYSAYTLAKAQRDRIAAAARRGRAHPLRDRAAGQDGVRPRRRDRRGRRSNDLRTDDLAARARRPCRRARPQRPRQDHTAPAADRPDRPDLRPGHAGQDRAAGPSVARADRAGSRAPCTRVR